MSVDVTIQGTVVSFPEQGTSQPWGPPVTEFAQLVEDVLNSITGAATYDVAPQTVALDAYNPSGAAIDINALNFPVSQVRAIFVRYSVYRTTSSTTAYETGNIIGIYNANGTVGSLWELTQDGNGDGAISFDISDAGQMNFTTTTLAGTGHAGKLTFTAQALLQT